MIFSKNKISISLLSCIYVFNSSYVFSDEQENYQELHNSATAKSLYESYKNGNSEDPFFSLDTGYKWKYSSDIETYSQTEKNRIFEDFIGNENNDLSSYIHSSYGSDNSLLSQLYSSHFDKNGIFDAAGYAEAYENLLITKRNSREAALDNRYLGLKYVIESSDDITALYRAEVNSNIGAAQVNLLTAINQDTINRKSSLNNILTDAVGRSTSQYSNLEGITLAANTYADCGSACELPEIPVEPDTPVVPPNPCVYTNDTYFAQSLIGNSRSGYHITNSWYWEGTRIKFESKNASFYGTFPGDITYRGNTYYLGSQISQNLGANMGGTVYELCSDQL